MANQIDIDAKIQGETYQGFGQQHIITISDGTLFAAQINLNNEIEVHKSVDSGANWTLETTLSSLTSPQSLSLCKSELDDLFVGFTNGAAGSVNGVIHRRTPGGVWSQVLNQNYGHKSTAGLPGFLITYNKAINRLHFFYTSQSNSNWRTTDNKYSDDKGSTWSAGVHWEPGQSTGAEALINCLGLDSDNSGNVYLLRQAQIADRAYIDKFSSSGVHLSTYLNSGSNQKAGALAIDSNNNIWSLTYRWLATSSLYLNKNTTIGFETIDASGDVFKHGMFSLGIDGADNLYIFYVRDTDNKTYYRKYNSTTATLESEQVFTTSTGLRPSCEQRVDVPGSIKLNVVFFTG